MRSFTWSFAVRFYYNDSSFMTRYKCVYPAFTPPPPPAPPPRHTNTQTCRLFNIYIFNIHVLNEKKTFSTHWDFQFKFVYQIVITKKKKDSNPAAEYNLITNVIPYFAQSEVVIKCRASSFRLNTAFPTAISFNDNWLWQLDHFGNLMTVFNKRNTLNATWTKQIEHAITQGIQMYLPTIFNGYRCDFVM